MNALSCNPIFLHPSSLKNPWSALRITCVTFFILLLLQNTAFAARQTPEVALETVQRAIDTSDLPLFEQHVDMNALLDQGSSALVARLQKSGNLDTSNLPPMLALMAASVQNPEMAKQIKQLLMQEIGSFARYGISSGMFAGKRDPNATPKGLLAPLLNDASTGRKTLKVTGKTVRDAASGSATVPVTIHDYGNGRDYRVTLRLEPVADSWQIKKIANIDKLLSRVQKEVSKSDTH